jgi:hypothetical protein
VNLILSFPWHAGIIIHVRHMMAGFVAMNITA